MFHYKLYEHKSLYGMWYIFPKVGDGLAMHDHIEAQKHNCMVMRGRVAIYGPDFSWYYELGPGEVMDLEDEHHPHEIYCLEDDTAIIGMFANGRPEGEYLPEEDKQGTLYIKVPTMVPPGVKHD